MEQLRQLGFSAILFLQHLGLVNISFGDFAMSYWPADLDALQAIYSGWNSTPNITNNLDGWSASQKNPCSSQSAQTVADLEIPDWRGVQCLRNNCTVTGCNVYVVRLSVSNASIVGTLAPEIGTLTWMSMLELTGNPQLTGPHPDEIFDLGLSVLDLHDNGFNGSIPYLHGLLQLDLSGNKFTGPYPEDQLRSLFYLQTLSIGGNDLAGDINSTAFADMLRLEKLDISNNHFNGTLPILGSMARLTYLDVSRNEFVGQLPDLLNASALLTANFSKNKLNWTRRLQDTFNLTSKLTMLDLSFNKLGGDLPLWDRDSLGSIKQLYLHNNNLTGTLNIVVMKESGLLRGRSGFQNSTAKLEVMSLSNNDLMGTLSVITMILETTARDASVPKTAP